MPESFGQRLDQAAERLVSTLKARNLKIAFAESCTAGLIAATLGQTPGISEYLCGSAVVYRDATKSVWLNVSAADLSDPAVTAVSDRVAGAMAVGVLAKTPEAGLAASVTGYLGPDSPSGIDGRVFIGLATRQSTGSVELVSVLEVHLAEGGGRLSRQHAAAAIVLQAVADHLIRG